METPHGHGSTRLVLFSGLELTDDPPGSVGRYNQLRCGSWLAARILLYVYTSFPPLWKPDSSDPNDTAFAYRWRVWVEQLESMDKQLGSWAALAQWLAEAGTTHWQVQDIARAIIELAMRDAEIHRNALRDEPSSLAPYKECTNDDALVPDARNDSAPEAETNFDTSANDAGASSSNSNANTDEQAFMARIRSATGYLPRVRRLEKCIYRALALKNILLVHAVAAGAPDTCCVHQVIQEGSF